VTGFGLLGHSWEMAERAGARFVLDSALLPLYPGALEAAEAGVRTGGDPRNRQHLEGRATSGAPAALEALAYDPQTSGGLLAAIAPAGVDGAEAAGFVVGRVDEGAAAVHLA
jgi:selenide, water dikinase